MNIAEMMKGLAAQPSQEGYTTKELSLALKLSIHKTNGIIDQALAQGLMVADKKPRKNRTGQVQTVAVYVPVTSKRK